MRGVPWRVWLIGWLIAIVLTGGLVYVLTQEDSPTRPFRDPVSVETSIREVTVLPAGQAKVQGTVTSLRGVDVVGPAVRTPIELPAGQRATIHDADVDGRSSTIVWDGGRPFVLVGDGGGIDLGPASVTVDGGGRATWALADGPRLLLPGRYEVRTPVAVGADGLAEPRDNVVFTANDDTTIESPATVTTTGPLHLEGPGELVLDGDFTVETRDGTRQVTHLEFGPGPLVIDLTPDAAGLKLTATVQGPLR